MFQIRCVFGIVLIATIITSSWACKGCLTLDEYSLPKILPHFDVVAVKFDIAYPYGEKHDGFVQLADALVNEPKAIIGMVGIKDYGEKENEKLAQKYGLTKDDLPAIRLFVHDRNEPIVYDKQRKWTTDDLREFVRDNTNIYVGLPGCVEQLDQIAATFLKIQDKQSVIEKSENLINHLQGEEKDFGAVYVKVMKKIVKDGVGFVEKERKRVSNLVKDTKMTEKKKHELNQRLNVLKSFIPIKSNTKEEL